MSLKICKDCSFAKRAVIDMGPGQSGMGFTCTHQECRDPVNGEQLPCFIARREPVFCTITAKYFSPNKQEEVKANVIEIVK